MLVRVFAHEIEIGETVAIATLDDRSNSFIKSKFLNDYYWHSNISGSGGVKRDLRMYQNDNYEEESKFRLDIEQIMIEQTEKSRGVKGIFGVIPCPKETGEDNVQFGGGFPIGTLVRCVITAGPTKNLSNFGALFNLTFDWYPNASEEMLPVPRGHPGGLNIGWRNQVIVPSKAMLCPRPLGGLSTNDLDTSNTCNEIYQLIYTDPKFLNPASLPWLQDAFNISDPHGSFVLFDSDQDTFNGPSKAKELTAIQSLQWANQRVKDGVALARSGESGEALKCYSAALALYPQHKDSLVARGAAHATLGQYDAAFEDFQKALKLAPNDENATKYMQITIEKLHKLGTPKAVEMLRSKGIASRNTAASVLLSDAASTTLKKVSKQKSKKKKKKKKNKKKHSSSSDSSD
eukprot:GHVL01001354.1.p1 GENE.GHVL01001354.1~~GHVL01001354.1.p1  ORF type:complete len:404 (+),score=82.75 GHVL01001354.1:465-1676(+)